MTKLDLRMTNPKYVSSFGFVTVKFLNFRHLGIFRALSLMRLKRKARRCFRAFIRCNSSSAFDDFDNRLGLHDQQAFVKEMETLNEQFVAAAFDIQTLRNPPPSWVGALSADINSRRLA